MNTTTMQNIANYIYYSEKTLMPLNCEMSLTQFPALAKR